MKLMITGINGMLGQNLVKEFHLDCHISGIDLTPSVFDEALNIVVVKQDLTQTDGVKHLLEDKNTEVLIHCAAYTNVDKAEIETELAYRINGDVPRILAQTCSDLNIPMVHISTDYVFDGHEGPYRETDVCNPAGEYSKSKHAGEKAVLESDVRAAVIRPNILYGHGKGIKSSFVEWMIGELRAGNRVNIVDDQYNNPSYARRLAQLIRRIIEAEAWDVWHFGAREVVSRYSFALKIAHTFGLSSELIRAISTQELNQAAPRPMRSGLISQKIQDQLNFPVLSIDEELAMLKEEMDAA